MSLDGGTTLTSLTRDSAIATRRFSLLLPFGYACRTRNEWGVVVQLHDLQKEEGKLKAASPRGGRSRRA